MSKYEWERGTIKIPTKEWSKFRTGIIGCWNAHQLGLLEKAKTLHAQLKAAAKGKRGSKRTEAIKAALGRSRHEYEHEITGLVVEQIFDHKKRLYTYTLKGLPKKKDLGLLPTSKDARINASDACVILSNKGRTVTWDVGENNRACEHARATFLGQELFRLLGNITWTRGSGGKIIGNDEYNRDEGGEYEGGGGSYVTSEFSAAKQKQDKEAAARARVNRGGFGGYGGLGGRGRWY